MPRRKTETRPVICPACFPGGWPAAATALGCPHGSWRADTPDEPRDNGDDGDE